MFFLHANSYSCSLLQHCETHKNKSINAFVVLKMRRENVSAILLIFSCKLHSCLFAVISMVGFKVIKVYVFSLNTEILQSADNE